jgi:hypothetical protein
VHGVEQHRLADPAQAEPDHALRMTAIANAAEGDRDGVEDVLPAGTFRLRTVEQDGYCPGMTVFISITRLRVRSFRFMPGFAWQTLSTVRQVKQAEGFLGGSLLPDRQWAFWTMTLWRDADSMRAYMKTGPHRKAMPKLLDWCDEASVVHWEQDDAEAPTWTAADQRMRSEGRPSKVRWPSDGHTTLAYREPRVSRATPIAVGRTR